MKALALAVVATAANPASQATTPAYSISLGPDSTIANTNPGVPSYVFFPDGHITRLTDGAQMIMFWANSTSYRTVGSDVISSMTLSPTGGIIGPGPTGSFDNGGAWLYGVHRVSGQNLIGFYHAEDQEWAGYSNPTRIAWKSTALATSSDNGVSWTKQGQLLTSSSTKPAAPTWGGNGDFCVVWDAANSRWVCFYSETYIRMAISTDPNAMPGSWYKYYNGGFTEPGLGGRNGTLPGLGNHQGGNPSVHYNTYLQRWIMVFHSWDSTQTSSGNSIWLTTSADLVNWESPRLMVGATGVEKYAYPTVVGPTDSTSGQSGTLLCAYWPDKSINQRQFRSRSFTLTASGDTTPNLTVPASVTTNEDEPATLLFNATDAETTPAALSISATCSSSSLVTGLSIFTASPWTDSDVGAVAAVGSSTDGAAQSMTVAGSGADIWGTADQFHFRYQPLSGDGQITARLTGFDAARPYAKAGLMMRESTAAGARYGLIRYTSGEGIIFQRRTTAGGSPATQFGAAMTLPAVWLRLVRSGTTISAYRAVDDGGVPGVWQQVGTAQTIDVSSAALVGFAVTSQQNGTLVHATFDNVSGAVDTSYNRKLQITPAPDSNGSGTITVEVSDGTNVGTATFPITVQPVNDPPTLSSIPDVSYYTGDPMPTLPVSVGDIDNSPDTLVLSAASSNSAILADSGIHFAGTSTDRTLTLSPAQNTSGSSVITVQVSDGSLTATRTFNLQVFSALESWRKAYFGTVVNAADAADNADPDHDGLPNLIEYALGSVPTVADSGNLPSAESIENGVKFVFRRRLNSSLTYTPEWTQDMATWHTDGFTVQAIPGSSDGTCERVEAALVTGGMQQVYLRLRITSP